MAQNRQDANSPQPEASSELPTGGNIAPDVATQASDNPNEKSRGRIRSPGATDPFAAVRAAKTSTEYRLAIDGLQAELKRLDAEHSEAERARDRALLDDGGDVSALRAHVIEIATAISDARAVIAEAMTRQADAEKREAESDLQDLAAEAKRLGAEDRDDYKKFSAALHSLRELHAALDRRRGRLDSVNDALSSRGHPELRSRVIREAEPIALMPGLSRNGQRLDAFFRDLATPGMNAVLPRHNRRVGGTNFAAPAASPAPGIAHSRR